MEYSCFTVLIISAVQQSLPAIRKHMSSFFGFPSIWVTVEHWVGCPVLYSRFSLVFYFVHSINSIYIPVPIPNSSFSIVLLFSWPGETPAYHYGTHYSSAMIVASYLVRMEPFTQIFLRLQVKLLSLEFLHVVHAFYLRSFLLFSLMLFISWHEALWSFSHKSSQNIMIVEFHWTKIDK